MSTILYRNHADRWPWRYVYQHPES